MIAVTVVDRSGQPLVVLRDTLAMGLSLPISRQKAYTAMSFGKPSSQLAHTAVATALQREPALLFAGGGVPIRALGAIIGGLGVSGTPSANMDERCAIQGVRAIETDLDMLDP